MDWVFAVSKDERARGALRPKTAEAARRALRTQGAAVLRGALAPTTVDAVHQAFLAQFGAFDADEMKARALLPAPNPLLKVGAKRYDISPKMEGVLADPAVLANPLLLDMFSGVLGDGIRLGGLTIVVSYPGAELQRIHRDHGHLFLEGSLGTVLPTFAINVSIPLVDVDMETGPTGIWLGSHRWENGRTPASEDMSVMPFERGDCVLLDYRTLHTGLANNSRHPRPLLYLAYAREWFVDEGNHVHRTSLNMSLDTYRGLPESVQPLLLRAYTQAMRSAQMARSPEAVERPREDAC
jgi:hypothetical protein